MTESTVTSMIDLHDSEILAAEKVVNKLNERQGVGGINLEAFRREVIERFATEAKLVVDVKVYTTNQEGLFWFEIEIRDRMTEFDPDRQVHEVVNDILELGEGGVIKTPSGIIEGGHSHGGHSHSH